MSGHFSGERRSKTESLAAVGEQFEVIVELVYRTRTAVARMAQTNAMVKRMTDALALCKPALLADLAAIQAGTKNKAQVVSDQAAALKKALANALSSSP